MLKKFLTQKAGLVTLALVLLACLAISLIIASDAGTEEKTSTGKVTWDKDRLIIQSGKTRLQIAALPPVALDSLGFKPVDGDTITAAGFMSHGILVAREAVWKGNTYVFRDSLYQFTRPELGNWTVDQSKCIGCQQCYNNCPASAINMVPKDGRKKALIDQSLCTGCNTCIAGNITDFRGCPVKAISK